MAIKKYTNGSWVPASYRKYGTETDAITTLPATVIGDSTPISSYTIKGNMEQTGTPTPENPIMPSECGEKTENIMDVYSSYGNKVVNNGGIIFDFSKEPQCITINGQPNGMYPQVQIWGENGVLHFENGKTYTALIRTTNKPKNSYVYMLIQGCDAENNWSTIVNIASDMGGISFSVSKDYVDFRNIFVCQNTGITYDNMKAYLMIIEGSTTLPYEPYGYKLPLTLGGTTTNIYLGEVQTTRRIAKVELTGNESFTKNSTSPENCLYYGQRNSLLPNSIQKTPLVCDELPVVSDFPVIGISANNPYNVIYINFGADIMNAQPSGNTVEGLKEYLATQYAAGTPVTVWYVLTTPTTSILNEPIRKIGDYVDSVSGTGLATSGTAQELDVDTTLKPSELDLTYHGWHEHEDTKYST